jgi:predicted unusual protein kinase regulating ubiquinone biosynthesis (AarF/ABC1/UbiB family)
MRLLVVFRLILPLVVSFARDRRRWLLFGRGVERTEAFHDARAERVLRTIARLGPSFVKMAQLFSSRSDLIPEPYVSAISRLTDQVPPVPWPQVRATIERELGMRLDRVFERIDEVPIAAASLGQVHRARYRGEDVAVKVLRPNVEDMVRRDLAIAGPVLRWIVRRFPNPHLRNTLIVVDEFSLRIWEEMDFRLEAAHAIEMRTNLATNRRVRVPRVYEPLTRQRVLVLEFMEGTRVDRVQARFGDQAHDPGGIVSAVMELYLQMMLIDGFFHADPHPGNLLVDSEGRLVLLDFGMVIRVPRELRLNLVNTVFAAIRRDVDGVVAGLNSLGAIEPGAELGRVRELTKLLMSVAYERHTVAERIELLANEILTMLYDWPVRLPSELVYFARTAALIEGLGVRYDHRFNPITFAAPIAIRLRDPIMVSLRGPDGKGALPQIDWPTAIGAALGHAASTAARAVRSLLDAFAGELEATPRVAPADELSQLMGRIGTGLRSLFGEPHPSTRAKAELGGVEPPKLLTAGESDSDPNVVPIDKARRNRSA